MTRTCFVTRDLLGPVKNGGIGTAFAQLARLLAREGHRVTVLYLPPGPEEDFSLAHWTDSYAKEGITLETLTSEETPALRNSAPVRDAWLAYRWLKARDGQFDIVHFHEWHGVGAYAALAKKQGLAFADTRIVVQLHAQVLWHLHYNAQGPERFEVLESDALEKIAIEHADAVVSPSRYMLNYTKERGVKLPEDTRVIQNVVPEHPPLPRAEEQVSEFVFFGRLETRKGLELFCEALRRLPEGARCPVTFLGKEGWAGGKLAREYIAARLDGIVQWQVISTFASDMAQEYLHEHGRLAVIASLVENSPYAVLECLANGTPFLASSGGGTAELVAEKDRGRVMFSPSVPALAAKLEKAAREGIAPVTPAFAPEETRKTWLGFHQEKNAGEKPGPASPHISVCIAHHDRPALLARALDSLKAQTYKHFEVIVTDDGSTSADAIAYLKECEKDFAGRGWKLLRQPNSYLGAARNAAAKQAGGEWLLFMDDDNVARPEELATFAAATRSGADIYSCVQEYAAEDGAAPWKYHVPIGGALSAGLFENSFGDANALVRKTVFDKLGGFTEEYGLGLEDMEFFAKATLAGYRMEPVPEPLFLYRLSPAGMLGTTARTANFARAIRPYLQEFPTLAPALMLAQGYHLKFPTMHANYAGLEKDFRAVKDANAELKQAKTSLDAQVKLLADECHALKTTLDGIGPETVWFIERMKARRLTRAVLNAKVMAGNALFDGIGKLKALIVRR